MVKFSIIIPMYNAECYIGRCLSSILLQRFNNYEIIVIDDGSNDKSYSICNSWKSLFPKFFILIHQENKGVCVARNEGLHFATGEYIMFVDADDSLSTDCFEVLSNVIQTYNSPDIVEFLMNYISVDGTQFMQGTILNNGLYDKKYLADTFIPVHLDCNENQSIFYTIFNALRIIKRSLLISNAILFDEKNKRWEDWLFAMQVFFNANEMVVVKLPLYNYFANSNEGLCKKYIPGTYKFVIEAYQMLEKIVAEKYNMFSNYAIQRKMEQFETCILEIFNNEKQTKQEDRIIELLMDNYFQKIILSKGGNHKLFSLKSFIVSQKYREAFIMLKKLYR